MSDESAYQYAFVIALVTFLCKPVSQLSGADVQDTVQLARFRHESAQYLEKAAKSDFGGLVNDPMVAKINRALYKPDVSRFDSTGQPSTEELLANIDSALASPYQWISSSGPLSESGPQLFRILHRAALITGNSTSTNYYHILEGVCSGYVDGASGKPSDLYIQVYEMFKDTLVTQVELHTLEDAAAAERMVYKLREQGNNLMSNQAHAQAIQIYTEAIEICNYDTANNLSQLYTNRAIAYIALNCFREAILDLNLAIKQERSFTPAWTQLGYCHLYMGSSLTALKSYLVALKCSAGEILPQDFKPRASIEEYKADKIKGILPQFVQRLCQSISLTEKRAYQQGEPSGTIRGIVSDVRRILAVLRSSASEDDMEYFTFYPNIRDTMFRTISERMNRSNPGILTPEVAQNILASSGTEAIAITTPRDITSTFPGRRPGADDPTAAATTGLSTEEAVPEPQPVNPEVPQPANRPTRVNGIREMLNDFGEMMEGRMARQGETPTGQGTPATTMEPSERNDNPLRDVLRGVLPDGLTNIISQFTNGQNSRVYVNGRDISEPPRAPGNGQNNTAQEGEQGREDQDMDVPDLD